MTRVLRWYAYIGRTPFPPGRRRRTMLDFILLLRLLLIKKYSFSCHGVLMAVVKRARASLVEHRRLQVLCVASQRFIYIYIVTSGNFCFFFLPVKTHLLVTSYYYHAKPRLRFATGPFQYHIQYTRALYYNCFDGELYPQRRVRVEIVSSYNKICIMLYSKFVCQCFSKFLLRDPL